MAWLSFAVLVFCSGFWTYEPTILPIVVEHKVKPAAPKPFSPSTIAPDARKTALEAFFAKYKCLDAPYVDQYLAAADKYGLDWRLLPALSFKEESCTRNGVMNNLWGWESGAMRFESIPAGIDYVGQKLATLKWYKGLPTDQKLRNYNHNPEYPGSVESIMTGISP